MTDKTTKVIAWLSLIVALFAVAIAVSNSPKALSNVGAAGGMLIENYLPVVMYNDGYKSEKEIVLSGANGDITTGDDLTVTDDATISGGLLTLTTSNTATSSAIMGCVQTYATSTATAIRLVIGSIATSSTEYGGGNTVGLVGWQYGTCPH